MSSKLSKMKQLLSTHHVKFYGNLEQWSSLTCKWKIIMSIYVVCCITNRASAIRPEVAHPMCRSTSTIFSTVEGSINGDVIRFSTAITTPSGVRIPIAVEPNLIASMAYSTWKRRPSGENVLTPRSYSERVRNICKISIKKKQKNHGKFGCNCKIWVWEHFVVMFSMTKQKHLPIMIFLF